MNWLEFANPARFWWALLAVPIILLFVLRIRLRRRQVSTLLFWDQLFEQQPPRAWWRRLRNLLALLLQLAFLTLLVFALVDPLWSWQRRSARSLVYVIDNSASMAAVDREDGETRLDRARRVARQWVGSLRQRDTAAIVTAGGIPKVLIGTTADVRLLTKTIEEIEVTDQPTRISAAVQMARRLVADDQQREIVILTDGGDDDLDDLAGDDDVSLYGVGEAGSNLAITAFQVRRSVADSISFQVLVEVTNFGEQPASARLELELENQIVDVIPLELEPEQAWRKTLDHSSPEGGGLVATLNVSDALATDNRAVAILPSRDPIQVLLVTPGSLFLRSVFESIPSVELSIAAELPASIPAGSITVVHKTKLAQVPPGPCIVVDPVDSSDLYKIGEPLSQPMVAEQTPDSPLLAHTRLQNVLLPGARELEFDGRVRSLLSGPTDTPLYARVARSGGDVLVLTADLADGDLPLRIAFPVMMKNAIEALISDPGELRPSIAGGELFSIDAALLTADLPAAADSSDASGPAAALRSPRGEVTQLALPAPVSGDDTDTAPSLSLGPFEQVGLWLIGPPQVLAAESVTLNSDGVIPLAVNLANPNESDLRPRIELPAPPLATIQWGGHSLWFYLSLFALVGITLEWFLYQRRIIG